MFKIESNKNDLNNFFGFKLLLVLAFAISLFSCLPRKLDKWVVQQYGESLPKPSKKKSDYITITSSVSSAGEKMSISDGKTTKLLPLLVYWQDTYTATCALNPQIPVNNFTNTVLSYSNKVLKQKLVDKNERVELSIDTIPNVFSLNNKEHVIFLVLYHYYWSYLTLIPENKNMVISYKIFKQDNTVAKSGLISIADANRGFGLKMFQSVKKKTFDYLGQYDANITTMSKAAIDKLIVEL